MNKNVVIIDHSPSRGETIERELLQEDEFTIFRIPWMRNSGPSISRQGCADRISETDVVLLHGSERKWFEIFIRAREPSDEPQEKPILWHYRGSPYGRQLTTEEFRSEIEQVYNWTKLARRFEPILPVTEDIDGGSEIDWVVLLRERKVRPRSFDYCASLLVLCQGYMAVQRQAGMEDGTDCERALEVIGWKHVEGTGVIQNLNKKDGDVRRSSWWQQALGTDGSEVKQQVVKELNLSSLPANSKISRLIDQIYSSESVENVNLVAGAFLEIEANRNDGKG